MPGVPSGQWRMEANGMTLETNKTPQDDLRNGHPDLDTSYPYPRTRAGFQALAHHYT